MEKDMSFQALFEGVVYDERGQIVSHTFLGANGQPTLCVDGYATRTSGYDDAGNEIACTYRGIDGQPTLCKGGSAAFADAVSIRSPLIDTLVPNALLAPSRRAAVFIASPMAV